MRVFFLTAAILINQAALAALLDNGTYSELLTSATFDSDSRYSISRTVKFGFTVINGTDAVLRNSTFTVYAPVRKTATQLLIELKSSHSFRLETDSVGNEVMSFQFDELAPRATKNITIQASLNLSDSPVGESNQGNERFLQSEKYIEVSDPKIRELSNTFSDVDSHKRLEKIYRWVADNIQYSGYSEADHGALYALENKKGDCTEYTYLVNALARAQKMPARAIGGYVYDTDAVLRSADFHNWAEVYVNGAWRVIDAQKHVFMEKPSRYVAMRIITSLNSNNLANTHRFSHSGHGLEVRMN